MHSERSWLVRVELLHLDVVGVGELVAAANHERGGNLFKSGITGALTHAVDCALDLAGSAVDASEGVGHCHAEIVVMAVGGENDVFDAWNPGLDTQCGRWLRTFGWRGSSQQSPGNVDDR